VVDRMPCPQCGSKDTIESLKDELKAIRKRSRELEIANIPPGRYVSFGINEDNDCEIRFVYEICADCGVIYDPGVKDRAAEVRGAIAENMKLIPLDLMAEVLKSTRQ
jgi:hypothetical protein